MDKTYDATLDYTPASVRWPYRRLDYIYFSSDEYVDTGMKPVENHLISHEQS